MLAMPWVNLLKVRLNKTKANLRDFTAATGLVILHRIQIVNLSTHVILKFDGWPRKTVWRLFYAASSLCASFHSHQRIQNGVTVRERSIRVQISDFIFLSSDLEKIGHLFYAAISFVHHCKAMGEFKLKLVRMRSIRVKIGHFIRKAWFRFHKHQMITKLQFRRNWLS